MVVVFLLFQVLLYLQQFSQNMILKTHELEKVVDNLAYETKVSFFMCEFERRITSNLG